LKKDVLVYTNEELIGTKPELRVFSHKNESVKTYEQLYDGLKSSSVYLFQNDFYSN